MPDKQFNDIPDVLNLLERGAQSDRAARFAEAEKRVGGYFSTSPDWLLRFCIAAVEADLASALLQDAISFLREEDLSDLSRVLRASSGQGDVEELLDIIALQAPQLAPDRLDSIFDFGEWADHCDPLEPPASYHFIFDGGSPLSSPLPAHRLHPTWHLSPAEAQCRIGGAGTSTCPSCDQQLIHLATLDNLPVELGVTLPSLSLETCPSCLEPAFYKHDASGLPAPVPTSLRSSPQWENTPMVERQVRLAKTPQRWLRQSSTLSNDRQNLFKIGGLPSWVQGADVPTEPQSGRAMKFLLQFDSGLPTVDGKEMLWGSGGITYVFWDDTERLSCHFHQCT